MNDSAKYYTEKLYPLQNGVLSLVKKSKTPFFLTGGTALSRYYFHHRYSDDLDLFVANDPEYPTHVKTLLKSLTQEDEELNFYVDLKDINIGETYTQVMVTDKTDSSTVLQLDLVNDVAAHYGELNNDPDLGQVDSWQNILSNKLTALFRSEPKDVADIWVIAKNKCFQWEQVVQEAKSKEAGIEPETIYDILRSFPVEQMNPVKWIQKPSGNEFMNDLRNIFDDILFARENSLCS
ncbi:uncharacterized protein METZ01_LOCUS390616 [marine metagenome]|uniref:Nucleotidyl transferase AbiEii/AbiGii toxin family protein n=1 Tax=marine metagenome TaxID=408172 RepID=A0A382UU41_9ZZZZ